MPVTYLELENFKSYAGKQRIGPFREFTSVIGPNGSGKSNLMDAMSFVLGVQSRHLRSSQMRDLIFRPPGEQLDQDDDNSKQIKASATLIYQDEETKQETRFSRTISCKGVGEYHVNNKTVSFSIYEQSLAKIGVLLKGRNFLVFQGDVESTARKTPKELVAWFEDISTSAELKESYEEALENMKVAEEKARGASQKQKGFWKKKRELKGQKEEAERFRHLVDSKANLLTEFFLWQLFHIRTDIEEKEETLEDLNQNLEEGNKNVQKLAGKVRAAKKDASSARSAVSKLEKKRTNLVSEIDQTQPSIIQIDAQIKNLDRKITAENKRLAKITQESSDREGTLANLSQQIKEYTETEQHLQQEYEDMKSSTNVNLTEEQEMEYERIREAAAVAGAKPRHFLNAANRKLEGARAKAAALGDEMKELKLRKDDAMKKIKEFTDRKEKIEESIQKINDDLQNNKDELQSVQQSVQVDHEKRQSIDLELEKINHTLRDARDDRRKNATETRLEDAIAKLKRYYPGVMGRLVKLCQPTMKRYDLAVTVAGGKDMDAIVVDTKKTAFECIQYLRTNQIGTATFLPLDALQVPNPASTERIRAMLDQDSRYRLACDVIACSDESVQKAVMYAVGNSVVCDDLDCARSLCFGGRNRGRHSDDGRIKAVTLGGAVISKAGTMTGGVSNDDKAKAGRWNDRQVEKLRERREALEAQLADLDKADRGISQIDRRASRGGRSSRIEELKNQVGNLTTRLQYMQSDLKHSTNQMKEYEVLISSISQQEGLASQSLESIENQIETFNAKVQKSIQAVKDAEEEHYGPFREKTGLSDFRAYDEAVGQSREEFLKKRRAIREHLERLKAQKKYEDSRNFDEAIAKKQNSVDGFKKKLSTAKAKEDEILEEIAALKAKLANLESDLEEASRVEKEHDVIVKEAQSVYKAAQSSNTKLSKTINTEEAILERLRAKLHETLQKARVEEAEIPLISTDEEGSSDNTSRNSRAHRRGQSDDDDESEDQMPMTQGTVISTHFSQHDDSRVMKDRNDTNKIDFSHLRRQLKERLSDRKEMDLQKKFAEDIEKLSAQIEGMTPNMKAGDAFDTIVDQLEECSEDFSEAKSNSKKAARAFEEVKRKRSERFNAAFQHIADALNTIYKDMTKSSKHPLGGNAYLSLDDTDEPYNGGIKFTAMPPMKRYRDMEYLSGGEKTIAALALLFAIHSYHPAPFFVMDEVDAALDNINVLKLCNYIRQRSKDFQCIVISLKDMFYEQSQGLVGICRNVSTNSSRTLTLDLTKFDKGDDDTITKPGKRSRSLASMGPRKRSDSSSKHSLQ